LSGTSRTTGGKRKLIGPVLPSAGRKIGVRTKTTTSSKTSVLVSATGPLQLVENDVAPHIVVSRHAKGAGFERVNAKGRKVKGRNTIQSRQASVLFGLGAGGGDRRAVLHWGGNIYARYVIASSRGRHPWRASVNEVTPKVAEIHGKATVEVLESALR
jgi:hypothetical protein